MAERDLQGGYLVRVTGVARHAGLQPGDRVLSVDGYPLRDVIDLQFYADGLVASFEIERAGQVFTVEIARVEGSSWGIEFADPLFDGIRNCHNNCIFCFLKQLPRGWRRTLYLRDDDYRLSFLYGNFITLTNLRREDWFRLREQRLSPLYVSVHATDLELRQLLLGRRDIPDILRQLDRLGRLGIVVHAQVVLCPGLNDGRYLEQTLAHLGERSDWIRSVALVPVGLTRFQDQLLHGLEGAAVQLRPYTPAEARAICCWARPRQRAFCSQLDRSFLYLSDEFYLLAGMSVPAARFYDGFPQLENGVGLVRLLREDWFRTRRFLPKSLLRPLAITLVCATMIAPMLRELAAELAAAVEGLAVEVLAVENETFGSTVTVSGLLTGETLLGALRGQPLGQIVFLPRVAFDDSGSYTLDDVSVEQIERQLGRPVVLVERMGEVVAALADRTR